jgi:Autographiviridae terminase large subunit
LKKTPPKTRGQRLSPEYQGMLGQDRTCDSCDETLEVSWSTFAPRKTHPDGVSPTCRSCQRAAKRAANPTVTTASFPTRLRDHPDYWKHVDDIRDRMYATGRDNAQKAERDKLIRQLRAVTILKTDEVDGGRQEDRTLAFLTFVRIISPLISDWCDFGPVHTDHLIPAIMAEDRRALILASRNSGKSTLMELYLCWTLFRNPLMKIMVISGQSKRAKDNLRAVRSYIDQCPLLWHMIPTDDCIDSVDQFMLPAANGKLGASISYRSYSVASAMTGGRADLILLDDPEVRTDRTPAKQELLDTLVAEVMHILNPVIGRLVVLGTPQVGQGRSLYARYIKSGGYQVSIARSFLEYPGEDPKSKLPVLHSLWPERFPDEELHRIRRQDHTPREWDLHWRLELGTPDEDDPPLRINDFCTFRWDPDSPSFPRAIKFDGPELAHLERFTSMAADDAYIGPEAVSTETDRYVMTCGAVDPASGKEGRDEVGLSVVSVTLSGLAVVRYCSGIRGKTLNEVMGRVAGILQRFQVNKVVLEARADNPWPHQLQALMGARGYPVLVEAVYSGTPKGERVIDSISVPAAAKRVVILESIFTASDAAETVKQICGMRLDARRGLAHDDRVDGLAWGLQTVQPMILVEAADNIPTYSQEELDRLMTLPIRKGGINPDGPEAALFEVSEQEERLQMKLDAAIDRQNQLLQQGVTDVDMSKLITSLQADLAKFQKFRPATMTRPGHNEGTPA